MVKDMDYRQGDPVNLPVAFTTFEQGHPPQTGELEFCGSWVPRIPYAM